MTIWVGVSLVAAFLQNVRSALQKHLTARLSTHGATATRFLYGLPFALLGLALAVFLLGAPPPPTLPFAAFALAGSLAQIGATTLLLASFSSGSFAAGTAYSKTEAVQAALFGYLFLGDRLSAGGLAGVVLSVFGVLSLSRPRAAAGGRAGVAAGAARHRGAVLGLFSGALFALSAVCYRGAALALGDAHFVLRATLTLVFALGVQSVVTAGRLRLVEPGELTRVRRAWRPGLAVGLAGAGASAGWFVAFTLVNASYVKAVGSVELVFAVLSSWLLFRERPAAVELVGVALVMLGVVVTAALR